MIRNHGRFFRSRCAFTLIEMLVAISVLLVILYLVFAITTGISRLWQSTTGKIGSFEEARSAFDSITRSISQATLNTYLDYANDANGVPTAYVRKSELHFICGPAASLITSATSWSGDAPAVRPTSSIFFLSPTGYQTALPTVTLDRALNAQGYYIEFNSDQKNHPAFITNISARYRYRLMKIAQPSENLAIYDPAFAQKPYPAYNNWFNNAITNKQVVPVADNIIALIFQPKLSSADSVNTSSGTVTTLCPEFRYDSRYVANSSPCLYTATTSEETRMLHRAQLPPLVQITLVAIDESSAIRLAAQNGTTAPPLVLPTEFVTAPADPSNFTDLTQLETSLTAGHLHFRVFSTTVSIRGAKWSAK